MNKSELTKLSINNIKFSEFKRIPKSNYYLSYLNSDEKLIFNTECIKLEKTGGGIQNIGKYCKSYNDQLKYGLRIPIYENSFIHEIEKRLEVLALENDLKLKLIDELNLKQSTIFKYKSVIVKSKNKKYTDTYKTSFNIKYVNDEKMIGTKFFKFKNLKKYVQENAKNDEYELINVKKLDDLNKAFDYNSQSEFVPQFLIKNAIVERVSSSLVFIKFKLELQQILFQTNKKKYNKISDLPFLAKK